MKEATSTSKNNDEHRDIDTITRTLKDGHQHIETSTTSVISDRKNDIGDRKIDIGDRNIDIDD